jgi:hypothetical protein
MDELEMPVEPEQEVAEPVADEPEAPVEAE